MPASRPRPEPGGRAGGQPGSELAALARLAGRLPRAPVGETWIGDDTAVLRVPGPSSPTRAARGAGLYFATDCLVEGVHFDRGLSSFSDLGWKALTVNVSDVAAMGGEPFAAVAAVAGATAHELDEITDGILEAAESLGCPLVGGDLSAASEVVVTVSVLGTSPDTAPVLRSGARVGDLVWVTGPLGSSAAGLRLLRDDPAASGPLVMAHRRPVARLAEGGAAARAGATAMIDCSDGLGLDLDRIARASGVGVALDTVPVSPGATFEEAIGGGEDFELVFTAGPGAPVGPTFANAGLREPLRIGVCVADPLVRLLGGGPLGTAGYSHRLG